MSDEFDPAAIERLAIECFARVRGDRRGLGSRDGVDLDLEVVPDQARAHGGGVVLTIRAILWRDGQLSDIREQEVWAIPGALDDARIPAYFEGTARGIALLAERGGDLEQMPADYFPFRAARDLTCRTAEQFAARVGEPEPPAVIDIVDPSAITPVATNADLERVIDDDPDRVESFLVYADWLTEHGDPRGELVALQVPDASQAASRQAAQVIAKHETYFVGPFLSSDRIDHCVDWTMRLGYFDRVSLSVDYDLWQAIPDFVPRALRALMQLGSSRFLRELRFGNLAHDGQCDWSVLYPILVDAGPRRSLHGLHIGDITREDQELSWTSAGDLGMLRGLYPNLRTLRVHAGRFELAGGLDYPKLEKLSIETGGLTAESARAIASQPFPALRDLEIWFGDSDYGATATLDDIAPILAGAHLPVLERLALRNCEFTDELCAALAASKILPRLRQLDLSMGTMTDEGAQILTSSVFGHLTKLEVSDNYLTDTTRGPQKTADGDRRYVTVGE